MKAENNETIRYLPSGGVVTEVTERVLEPGVNLVERQLSLR